MLKFLLWWCVYAASSLLGGALPHPWGKPAVLGLYTLALLAWCLWRAKLLPPPRRWQLALPLLALPLWNLTQGLPQLSAALVCSLFGAVAEELLLRGLVLQTLPWKSKTLALWGSSLLFSLLHLLNTGFSTLQLFLAFAAGLAFGAVTLKCRSLLPALAAHLLINLTATAGPSLGLWLCGILYLTYGLWLTYYNKEM